MKKLQRKTKDEKRRVLLNKKSEVKQARIVKYGSDSVAVVAKDVNRRFIAAFLALVFVLTTLVVGVNFITKAALDDDDFNMYENIDDSGLVLRKGLKDNGDGTFDLKMEAYATAPFVSKTYEANTPLDVVLVMDQSGSMRTKDVLTGQGYQVAEESYQNSNPKATFKISDIQNGEYYYRVVENDVEKFYRISVSDRDENVIESYVPAKENGSVKDSWTAEEANNWVTTNGNNVFYLYSNETPDDTSDDTYEKVWMERHNWYKSAGSSVALSSFVQESALGPWNWNYDNDYINEFYYNSAGNINEKEPVWHLVHENTHGVTLGGYYVYLWYYAKEDDTPSITDERTYNSAVTNEKVFRVPNDNTYSYSNGFPYYTNEQDYDAWDSTASVGGNRQQSNDQPYIGGQLYRKVTVNPNDSSVPINYMFTSNDDGVTALRTLAWPDVGSSTAISVQSIPYEGIFYTAGYLPYYTDDNNVRHYIGTPVFGANEDSYVVANEGGIPLYEKKTITRLDAEKLGATNLAQQIAGAVTEDADHRIAVVGFNNSGSVKSGLVQANTNDSSPDNDVNDAIDAALTDLSASGTGSSVAAGLTTAQSIFANNQLDPADSRKRIVVVFTDDDAVESAANGAAETLKNTYHASVYTIGYDKDGVSSAVENWLNHLSSNYYASTETSDGIDYYTGTTNKATILDAFEGIEIASPTTMATLGTANAVLRDIISKDFIVPQNPSIEAYTVSVDSFDQESGMPEWDDSTQPFVLNSNNLTVTPNNNGTTSIDITGFDYSSNYVSASRANISDGKKLVVTISGLQLKDNVDTESDRRIYSNTKNSGLYKHGAEDLLIAAFPRPFVDKKTNLVPNGTSGIQNGDVVVNKYLTANENGNYDLTLEAYSTAKNEQVTTTEKIPTDFVIVVDQSGSMDEQDMPTGTATPQNNVNLETVANGSYYYYDEATDNYYKVYGVKDYLYRYYPANYWFTGSAVDHLGADIGWFMREEDATENIDNAFYFREVVDGKAYYQPIRTTIRGRIGTYAMRFSYNSKLSESEVVFDRRNTTYSSNGNSPWYKNVLNGNVMNSGLLWGTANAFVQTIYPNTDEYTYSTVDLGLIQPKTGMYINYPMYGRHLAYTKLCYRDVNGVEHELPSNQNNGQAVWEFCDDQGIARSGQDVNSTRPTYSNLYTFDTKIRRIEALQAALGEFAEAVANETDSYGSVDNKVSIVGFSGGGENTYQNTELLTGTTFTIQTGSRIPSNSGYSADGFNHNGKTKSAATAADYAGALVSATNGTVGVVNGEITEAINAITAYGGTQPEDGLDMAYNVLANRSTTQYTIRSGDKAGTPVERNTVVIFFTDGQPGDYHYSNQYAEANDVVESAKVIKDSGASIFSIGVFGESDGNPLTYADTTQQQSKRASWKYLGGWMETYQSGGTYYCLRRQWRPGNDDYTETANDTIYDYMSVTSSNYPDAEDYIAPAWLNGTFNGNYIAATDGDTVRKKSTAEGTNKYYRMASSQDTLIEAFLQAITMNNQAIESDGTLGPSTILRDILENDNFEMTSSTTYTVETAKGKADSNGVVTFENEKTAITLAPPPSLGSDEIEVTGFDYATNSIYYGKPADTDNDLSEHQGRKLIVTLTNVVPKQLITSDQNDDRIFSNEDASGLWKNVQVAAFPKPAITRHSYTLDVGDDNKNAQFNVTTTLVAGSGASDDLSDVILVKPDGTRTPYNEVEDVSFTMGDGQTFYYENVPPGYTVKASTRAPDSFYTYTFWTDNETNKDTLSTNSDTNRTLDYSDHVLHVTSVSSYRDVTIAESVSGDYANTSDVFSVKVTLIPPNNDPYNESTIALANDVTLERKGNGSYEGTITDLPGDQNEKQLRVPAGWTLKVEPIAHERYDVDTGYPKYNTEEESTQIVLPNEGVVITSDLTNIFINNVAKDIPPEGILNSSSHNFIIYILAALAGLAAIGGGIFLWKKKDEFVEE